MKESYCGKNCADCTQREALGCPGCRPEEGYRVPGNCVIAACCNRSGHETCESCMHKENFCQTRKEKDDYPGRYIREEEARLRRQAEERQRREERKQRAMFLLSRFNILCILWTIGVCCNLIDLVGGKETPFAYVEGLISLIGLFVVFGMAKVNHKYKYVFYIGMVSASVSFLMELLGELGLGLDILFLLLSLPGIYGAWLELNTHGEVLLGIDDQLAVKWQKLARWYAWTTAAMGAGFFLVMLMPAFVLIVPMAAIAAVVVSLLQVVYLFQTRKVLSLYVEANATGA